MRKRRNREEEKGKQRKCGGRSTRRIEVEERKKKKCLVYFADQILNQTLQYTFVFIMLSHGVLQHITCDADEFLQSIHTIHSPCLCAH